MKKKIFIGIISIFALIASTTNSSRFFEIAKNIEIYSAIFKTINQMYVDEVNPTHLLNTSVESMLATLDPYTVYISEDKIEDFRTESTGQYGGIGAATIRLEGKVLISSVTHNGPAEAAGIEIGDEVITASGIEVLDKSNEELNQLVRGQANTSIVLGIRKNGQSDIKEISVIRDKIIIDNVPYYGLLKENVGYVKFTQFTENGGKNIEKALKELKKEGASSFIIDLRDNPGGLLHEAVNICNLFLPKGQLVVQTKGKRPENTNSFKTLNPPLDLTVPVVVLVNQSSASASEIVSGTLQDYDRAVIMGKKSYGKGLVQNMRPLSYNSQLKVTIAKYYTPSGRCIQALDYSHRNIDGSVGAIPDSLKTAFSTINGRKVYDGGGIDPDIKIEDKQLPNILIELVQQGRIYTYANVFKLKNEKISSPADFNLSDAQYGDFIKWMSGHKISFESSIEKQIHAIDKYSESIHAQSELFTTTLASIKEEIHVPLEEQLFEEKNAIKRALEAEIALRYYNEEGGIEASLGDDIEIEKAIELLKNPTQYNAILSGANK